MKNQSPNIVGAVLACIVAGAAGCCGAAVIDVAATAIAVGGNVAGNLAASSLDPLFQRLMRSLCHRDILPEAKPLAAALRQSSHRAVDHLKILLRQKLENEYSPALSTSGGIVDLRMKQAEPFFAALHEAVDAAFDGRNLSDADADEYLSGSPEQALDHLRLALRRQLQDPPRQEGGFLKNIFSKKEDPPVDTKPLEDFFVKKFPAELERCFTHTLAGDTHARAAFQQLALNGLRQDSQTLLGGQEEIKSLLLELLGAGQFAPQFQLVLTDRHNVLVGKMDGMERSLLDVKTIAERTLAGVEGLQTSFDNFSKVVKTDAPPPHELNYLPILQNPAKEALGRDDDVEELHHLLAASPLVAVVRGIGGMGKTTLARAFLTRYKNEYDHVAWIGGADKLLASCAAAILLHERLGLRFTDEPEEERFRRTMAALHKLPGNNLLVLDNAAANLAETHLDGKPLHHYLPGGHWKKLATSRGRIGVFKHFDLQKLPHEAAVALFEEYYDKADGAGLTELFRTVGYHTLTIEILAKTLRASKGELTLARLQASLGRHRLDDEALQHRIEVEHDGSDAGVYLHLLDTFAEAGVIPDTTGYRVLQHFLLLPSEGLTEGLGHPFSFLKEALVPHAAPDARSLSESLDHLCDLGWLTAEQDHHFSLHRLLRDVLLYQLKPAEQEVEGFITHVTDFFDFDTGTNFTLLFPKLFYGDAILEVFENSQFPAISVLQNQLGEVYRNLGRYEKAAALLEAALDSKLKNFGKDHPNVAVRQSNLAMVYKDLGRYREAAALINAALKSSLENFGEMHPTVARLQSNLALVYRALGRYREAAALMESALKSGLENIGELHPEVAVRQSNLAMVYRDLGRYEEAASLMEAALNSDLENLGEKHPEVAVRQSNLAMVYRDLVRDGEAAGLMEAALKSDLENFGEKHPAVAVCQSNLAVVYQALGRYEEAAALMEAALNSDLENFGEKHPAIAVRQSNLAMVYKVLGRYGEAAALMDVALKSDLENFGKDHPNVARCFNNLAWIYRDQQQWGKVLPLFEQAYRIWLQALGEGHPYTQQVQESIAYVREQLRGPGK